jgi:2-polyprenyl-3-methyl-5-hydroxy-6-metoxy-1,4-benzoquinol methylase
MRERELIGELMDDPGLPEHELTHALRGLSRLNSISLAAGATMLPLCTLADELRCSQARPLRVLDVACADAELICAAARISTTHPRPMLFFGCDINPRSISLAQQQARAAQAATPPKDAKRAMQPPTFFVHDMIQAAPPGEYDVVMCSLFLHHLSDEHALRAIQHMARAARHAVLINDLVRSRIALAVVAIASRILTRSRIVHVDSLRSVRAAFTRDELLALCERAALPARARWGGFARTVIVARTDGGGDTPPQTAHSPRHP